MTERERLIELLNSGISTVDDNFGMPNSTQLADYLLDHGVIVPLCKLGTPIWRILYLNTPDDDYYMSYSPEWVVRGGYFAYNDIENFGKTVFIDKNEAEQALKARENDA